MTTLAVSVAFRIDLRHTPQDTCTSRMLLRWDSRAPEQGCQPRPQGVLEPCLHALQLGLLRGMRSPAVCSVVEQRG